MTLANSDSSFKPFKHVTSGHDRAGALVEGFNSINHLPFTIYHLPPGYVSLRKKEPLPELSPQMPVSGYSWPRRTQVADKAVSPSCFRSSLPPCPFSWCPLCHSFWPSVVFESCNVSRPSMYSLLDNIYDIIYTCPVSYPGITFVVA